MHEIEKWIEKVYNSSFKLDKTSVKEFLRRELRESPLEKPINSMNILSGVVEMNSMYAGLYILEVINYRQELRENDIRERNKV